MVDLHLFLSRCPLKERWWTPGAPEVQVVDPLAFTPSPSCPWRRNGWPFPSSLSFWLRAPPPTPVAPGTWSWGLTPPPPPPRGLNQVFPFPSKMTRSLQVSGWGCSQNWTKKLPNISLFFIFIDYITDYSNFCILTETHFILFNYLYIYETPLDLSNRPALGGRTKGLEVDPGGGGGGVMVFFKRGGGVSFLGQEI